MTTIKEIRERMKNNLGYSGADIEYLLAEIEDSSTKALKAYALIERLENMVEAQFRRDADRIAVLQKEFKALDSLRTMDIKLCNKLDAAYTLLKIALENVKSIQDADDSFTTERLVEMCIKWSAEALSKADEVRGK